MELNSCF